jgi:hypothetical protein
MKNRIQIILCNFYDFKIKNLKGFSIILSISIDLKQEKLKIDLLFKELKELIKVHSIYLYTTILINYFTKNQVSRLMWNRRSCYRLHSLIELASMRRFWSIDLENSAVRLMFGLHG